MGHELATTMQDQELRRAFGARVKAFRKQQKWTQKELAGKLSTSFSQLNKYECGLSVPPAEKLVEMAELMGATVDYLLTGSRQEDQGLPNPQWLKRFRALEELPLEEQDVAIKVLDAIIMKHRMEGIFSKPLGRAS